MNRHERRAMKFNQSYIDMNSDIVKQSPTMVVEFYCEDDRQKWAEGADVNKALTEPMLAIDPTAEVYVMDGKEILSYINPSHVEDYPNNIARCSIQNNGELIYFWMAGDNG